MAILPNEVKIKLASEYDKKADRLPHIQTVLPKGIKPQNLRFFDSTIYPKVREAHIRNAREITLRAVKNTPYEKYMDLAYNFVKNPKQIVATHIANPTLNDMTNGGFISSLEDTILIRERYSSISFPLENTIYINENESKDYELNDRKENPLKDLGVVALKLIKKKIPVVKVVKVRLADGTYALKEVVIWIDKYDYEAVVLSLFKELYYKFLKELLAKYPNESIEKLSHLAETMAKDELWKHLEKTGYPRYTSSLKKIKNWSGYHASFISRYGYNFKDSRLGESNWIANGVEYYDNRPIDEHGKVKTLRSRIK